MPDQKTFTLAEFREAQRDAFEAGAEWVNEAQFPATRQVYAASEAERRYPMPTTPRVIDNDGFQYRIDGHWVERRADKQSLWVRFMPIRHYTAVSDLLANPTEPSDE